MAASSSSADGQRLRWTVILTDAVEQKWEIKMDRGTMWKAAKYTFGLTLWRVFPLCGGHAQIGGDARAGDFRIRVGGDEGSEINAAEWPQAFKDGLRLTMNMDGLKQPTGLRTEKVVRVWKSYNFGPGYESGGAVLPVEFIQGGEEPVHKFIDPAGSVTYFRGWHLKTLQVNQAIQLVLNALLTSHRFPFSGDGRELLNPEDDWLPKKIPNDMKVTSYENRNTRADGAMHYDITYFGQEGYHFQGRPDPVLRKRQPSVLSESEGLVGSRRRRLRRK